MPSTGTELGAGRRDHIADQLTTSPAGLSGLAAKILDQLSVSAWLPAGLFAGTLALLLQFRAQKSADLQAALEALSKNWLPVVLLAIPVLVLGTLMTQAFSFDAIRALEGYWMRRWPTRWMRDLLIRRQVHRYERLKRRKSIYARLAFDKSEPGLAGLPAEVVMALRAQAHELRRLEPNEPDHQRLLTKLNWRDACDPWDLMRFDDARSAVKEYPKRHRILPTRLGNILRACEDSIVKDTGLDLLTFALRRRSWLEPRSRLQHDQFRTRLDMYCTLVFVALGTAVAAALLTWGETSIRTPFLFIAGGYVVVAFVAYQAALGSARGYVTILLLMKNAQDPDAQQA